MALSRPAISHVVAMTASVTALLVIVGTTSGQTGSAPRARQLADTVIGSGSGVNASFSTGAPSAGVPAPAFVTTSREIYFRAGTSSSRNDLFRTEGRPGTTQLVFSGLTSNFVVLKDSPSNAVVFLASPTGGTLGMYGISDQNPSGSLLAAGATVPGTQYTWSDKKIPTLRGNALFIAPQTTGPQVWITDGTVANTAAITTFVGANILDIATTSTAAYFLVQEGSFHRVYSIDGPGASVRAVWTGTTRPSWGSSVPPLATTDDAVFFAVQSGSTITVFTHSADRGLSTNISMPGPTLTNAFIWTTRDGSGIYFERMATGPSGSRKELWRFAADESLSSLLIDFPSDTTLTQLGASNGITLFGDSRTPYAPTPTLWITDGSPQGTFGLPGFMSSSSADQTRASASGLLSGSQFWFNATSTATGVEPACMDLFTGTLTQFDAAPGTASSTPGRFTAMGHGHGAAFAARVNNASVIMNAAVGRTPRTITSTVPYSGTPMGAIGHRLVFWSQTTNGQGIEPHVIDLCPADYDNSGTVSTVDLFSYVNDFMAGLPKADTDGPGTPPTTTDLIDYLNSWFVGC